MTTIAPYYKKLTEDIHRYSENRHPASFIGMFDCGKDYVFNLLATEKPREGKPIMVPIDLANSESDNKKVVAACYFGFSKTFSTTTPFNSFEDVWQNLNKACKKSPVTLVFDFGDDKKISLDLLKNLYAWENLLGNRLNWIIFANYRILHLPEATKTAFEKIIKTNIIPVLPTDYESSLVVFKNYEEYFGKVKKYLSKKIIGMSGGNPGLLKSLFLLAQKGDLDSWHNDSAIMMRLNKILGGLNQKELDCLLSLKNDSEEYKNLRFFGYIDERNKVFSPIVKAYLPIYFDNTGVKLSTTQQKIFSYLKDRSPLPTTRDEVAKAMWGGRWTDKYSDWAIDQIIYAMRSKLDSLKSGWDLKTKRGFGYFLVKKNIHG